MSWLNVDEYARVMRMHPVTVRRLCREGKVPGAFKIGKYWRIRMDDPPQGRAATGQTVTGETITGGF